MICHVCDSENIKFYRQIRKDGVAVIVARCENDHTPEKGKPFYSKQLMNVFDLPILGEPELEPRKHRVIESPTLLEFFEEKKRLRDIFPPLRTK